MKTAARTDSTHKAIVQALRAYGATVQSLASIGKGCPDLLVGYHGHTLLVEVKAEKGLLRASQDVWASNWRGGGVHIVRNVEDVSLIVGELQ